MLYETESDMNRIDDVINYEVDDQFKEVQNGKPIVKTEMDNKLVGYFEMKNVTFGYNTTLPALIENFNLKLKARNRVAPVGGSGSGKSTVAKIASGLHKPRTAKFYLMEKREEIPRNIITESLAVIDQDVLIFNGTIKENISFGIPLYLTKALFNLPEMPLFMTLLHPEVMLMTVLF